MSILSDRDERAAGSRTAAAHALLWSSKPWVGPQYQAGAGLGPLLALLPQPGNSGPSSAHSNSSFNSQLWSPFLWVAPFPVGARVPV